MSLRYYCFIIILTFFNLSVNALSYPGNIKKISDPIKLKYNFFEGKLSGKSTREYTSLGEKETQIFNQSISIKKNNSETLIIEIILKIVGDTTYKVDIYLTPNGEVKNSIFWITDYDGGWYKLRKKKYKKFIDTFIESSFFEYKKKYKTNDVLIDYPFKSYVLGLVGVEGLSRSDLQLTDKFNLLDAMPEVIQPKIMGTSCFNGRNVLVAEFNTKHKYENFPAKSNFTFIGYQLIDIATGIYFHGSYKFSIFADFGETIDSGLSNFDLSGYEKLDMIFEIKNCEDDNIINQNTSLDNNSNNKKNKINLDNTVESKKNDQSLEDRLIKLKSIFDKELITKEEYDEKRKEILDEL